jgi:hypothetical protein
MKRSGSLFMLSLLVSGALAASADAATVPLQIPGLAAGKVPAQIGLGIDDSWKPPVLPGTPPPNAILGYEQTSPLSDGATCVRGVWAVGVAVRPADRPVLDHGTLRLNAEGSLLPRMKVQRHGVAGPTRWYAGGLREEGGLQVQQGVAVLPAPRWATRNGRSLIVARVSVGLNVRHTVADGATLPVTGAERSECYAPLTAGLGPQLRGLLRGVSVQRRP